MWNVHKDVTTKVFTAVCPEKTENEKKSLIIKKTDNGTLTQPSITKQLQIVILLFIFGMG